MKNIVYSIILFYLLFPTPGYSQSPGCNCEKDLDYVVSFIEANFPGFNKNVTPENAAEYERFKKQIYSQVRTTTSKNECLKYLTYYVEFFKDNHTKMRTPRGKEVDESSAEQVRQFLASDTYSETETIPLRRKQLRDRFPIDDIRGVYLSSDSTYTVALIESKTNFRDYVGVILDSKSKLWARNQVKFELKHKEGNIYEGFFYDRYHQAAYNTAVPFNDGFLGDTWIKANKRELVNHSLNKEQVFSYSVKDSTVILRIPSFMGRHTRTLDSLYHAARADIEKYPYLLIDVRNNGGGNSSNFHTLLPYLYTRPIIDNEQVELYATKDIIQLYETEFLEIMKDSAQVNSETIRAFREGLEELKQAKPNTFVSQGEPVDTLVMEPRGKPVKIGILYNRGCASACEDLLFKAKHSDKTLLLGDNSGGFVGYGNIFTVYTPCYGFGLSCSTTRYSTQWEYEVVGIEPTVKLDYNHDWIEQAIEILRK